MGEVVDGEYQKYAVEPGCLHPRALLRQVSASCSRWSSTCRTSSCSKLRRGGHDPEKVYAAYKAAVEHKGQPTVILAKTIKGYGLGEAGEGRNITHQQKKLNEDELREFRTRFGIPISDEDVAKAPFYRPADDSAEIKYLQRAAQGAGRLRARTRKCDCRRCRRRRDEVFEEFFEGSDGRKVSTTMAFVRHARASCCEDKEIGNYIVPIVPDEARTFGMEALFRQCGIYSSVGQLYEPVDADTLLLLQGSEGRPDSRRRHHRSRLDVVVHRRRHRLRDARREHDPVLHLLLDVRLPAHRRSDLGRRRHALPRASCSAAPPAAPRSTAKACSIRTATAICWPSTVPNVRQPTIRPSPTRSPSSFRTACGGCTTRRETSSTTSRSCNENYPMPAMPEGAEEGILKGMYKLPRSRRRAEGEAASPAASAAARSCARR